MELRFFHCADYLRWPHFHLRVRRLCNRLVPLRFSLCCLPSTWPPIAVANSMIQPAIRVHRTLERPVTDLAYLDYTIAFMLVQHQQGLHPILPQ